jgi:hypothetical protein
MKWFFIRYTVDTGYDWIHDTALVQADNRKEAEDKIMRYISDRGHEYFVHDIDEVYEFTGSIFTGKFDTDGGN